MLQGPRNKVRWCIVLAKHGMDLSCSTNSVETSQQPRNQVSDVSRMSDAELAHHIAIGSCQTPSDTGKTPSLLLLENSILRMSQSGQYEYPNMLPVFAKSSSARLSSAVDPDIAFEEKTPLGDHRGASGGQLILYFGTYCSSSITE